MKKAAFYTLLIIMMITRMVIDVKDAAGASLQAIFLVKKPAGAAQQPVANDRLKVDQSTQPLEVVKTVADMVISQARFDLKYSPAPKYKETEIIDFGRNYGKSNPGYAYAASSVISKDDQDVVFEISHSEAVKIWINDKPVYEKTNNGEAAVMYKEKTFALKDSFNARLQKGANSIFIKTTTRGKGDWIVYLQSANMREPAASPKYIFFSLEKTAPDITTSNWLIMGIFPPGMKDPSPQFIPGQYYANGPDIITWGIPRTEIVADVVRAGEYYNWNYHVGGLMWAMQVLSQETKDSKYAGFSNKWTEFILATRPLIEHQVKELHAVKSAFSTMIDRPMLDYSTAPALPFMARLAYEKQFSDRQRFLDFVRPIIDYAKKTQQRLADGTFARQEPEALSVWVDDMFMGIPFLLFAAELSTDEQEKKLLYDDAAGQIISFNKYLFDPQVNLYRHTSVVHKPGNKYPHWSRANGWGLWAASEVLLRLPKQHPRYKQVMAIYKSHMASLVSFQNPATGFWRNVLDKQESKDETSGTAIFTMALARGVNNKWLTEPQYRNSAIKGWNALQTVIEKNGTVYGTVVGTNVSMDPNFYYNRPVADNDTHGIFPLIFTGIEMSRMLK